MSTMVIDGKPASARSGATVEIHDPATGERVDTVPQAGVEETRQAIDAAHAAFRGWAETLPQKRTQILMKGAALARQHLRSEERRVGKEGRSRRVLEPS